MCDVFLNYKLQLYFRSSRDPHNRFKKIFISGGYYNSFLDPLCIDSIFSTVHSRQDNFGMSLDRAKRYGSMRGQELAETVARVAGRAVGFTF